MTLQEINTQVEGIFALIDTITKEMVNEPQKINDKITSLEDNISELNEKLNTAMMNENEKEYSSIKNSMALAQNSLEMYKRKLATIDHNKKYRAISDSKRKEFDTLLDELHKEYNEKAIQILDQLLELSNEYLTTRYSIYGAKEKWNSKVQNLNNEYSTRDINVDWLLTNAQMRLKEISQVMGLDWEVVEIEEHRLYF